MSSDFQKLARNLIAFSLLFFQVRNPYSLRAQTYVDVFILTKESLDRVKECYPAASDVIAKNGRRLFPDLHF